MIFRPHHGDEGQGLVEYALIIALIGVVLVGAVAGLGTALNGSINDSAGQMFN